MSNYIEIEIEDYICFIGRNAKGNDQILRSASQKDLWFHLDNISSPHLILKMSEKIFPSKEILLECAIILKSYKNSISEFQKVNVIYTLVSNIKLTKVLGQVEFKCNTKVSKLKRI